MHGTSGFSQHSWCSLPAAKHTEVFGECCTEIWLMEPARQNERRGCLGLDAKKALVCVSTLGGESARCLAASVLLYSMSRCPFCFSKLHFSLQICPSPFLCLAPCTQAVIGSLSLSLFPFSQSLSLPQTAREIPADSIWHHVFIKLSDTCLNLPCCPLLTRPCV